MTKLLSVKCVSCPSYAAANRRGQCESCYSNPLLIRARTSPPKRKARKPAPKVERPYTGPTLEELDALIASRYATMPPDGNQDQPRNPRPGIRIVHDTQGRR